MLNVSTYCESERVQISRFVEFSLEMTFRAAPIVISRQHAFDAPGLWKVGHVLKISDLHLFHYDVLVILAVVDHDIVRFDI